MEELLKEMLWELRALNEKMDRQFQIMTANTANAESHTNTMKAQLEALKKMMPPNMHPMFDQFLNTKF